VPGDWNAFFGLFTNVLLNVLVLTGLVIGVVQLPNDIVFGRILPALGIALPLGNLYYAYLAWQLAQRENRSDVAALPYGPSVPHMFIVVFAVMVPIALQTGDPLRAWQAGLAWAFIIGIVILIGAFVGPTIRRYLPRAAMLGTLAGVSITFISMRPAFQSWDVPWVALLSLTLVLVGWTANVRLPGNLPAGLVAVIAGTALGWATGIMNAPDVTAALSSFGFFAPTPSTDVVAGFAAISTLLVTAIPLGIYNFVEAMNNVESASAAGDDYPLHKVLFADGIGAIVGSFLGSPFPPAVYIGHPGWKAVGGRIGYSLATGVCVALVCFLGLAALLLSIIPLVAILPILLYIGLVIGAQAFQTSPARYAPAIVLAILPSIADWGRTQVNTSLNVAGVPLTPELTELLNSPNAIVYEGMARFGSGAVLAGLMLGAIGVFIIDRKFRNAAIFAAASAALTFFGLIHGDQIGVGVNLDIVAGYLIMAGIVGLFAVRGETGSEEPAAAGEPGVDAMPAAETGSIELFVNGTLMRGLELNQNLEGAEFLGAVRTAPIYRLFSIDDVHPGMFQVIEGGVPVAGELYLVPPEVWLRVEAGEPPGLYRGPVLLEDGRLVQGILYPRQMAEGRHRDISEFGDWRAYRAGAG
jgi:AGZA family xanthine/uracil permease-like MFS transporter